jgi:hypothetical protein
MITVELVSRHEHVHGLSIRLPALPRVGDVVVTRGFAYYVREVRFYEGEKNAVLVLENQ